jgi:hypothetical protein
MALQTSGPISISQIKTELGSTSNSLRALSAAAGKSTPDAMSEFYGYASYTPPSYISGANSVSGTGTQSNPYVISKTSGYTNYSWVQTYQCDELYEGSWYAEEGFFDSFTGNNVIKLRNNQSNAQRMWMTINTFDASPLCSAYNLVEIYWGGVLINNINNSVFLNQSSNGETLSTTLLKNQVQNVRWDLPANNLNLDLNLHITARSFKDYKDWLPGNCDGEGAPFIFDTFGCPQTQTAISNFTMTIWWEPL